jgi:hypothetical protein
MYNLPKLKSLISSNPGAMPIYVVHPAFRMALEASAEPQGQEELL